MAATPNRSLAWISTAGLALMVGVTQPRVAAAQVLATETDRPIASSEPGTPATGESSLLLSAQQAVATQAAASPETSQPPAAPAPDPEQSKMAVTGGVTVDLFSHYVWRGFVPTDAFSFQPTVWAKVKEFTISSWSSFAKDQPGGPAIEHDFTVDYTKAVSKTTTLSVGYINYFFPSLDVGRHSDEFYVVSAFATILNPTVKAYFDVHEGKGTYLNFGISQPIPIPVQLKGVALTPSFALGYNDKQWIDESAWNDANFGLKLTVPINGHLTLGPGIYYSKGLNDAIPDKFYGGLSIVTTF